MSQIRKILFIGFLGLILVTCSKDENPVSPSLYGDYEWVYSKISGTKYIDRTETGDSYGLQINEDGIYFVKNSSIVEHHKNVNIIFDDMTGYTYIRISDKSTSETIDYGNDRIIINYSILDLKNFPFQCNEATYSLTGNYFKKK